MNKRILILCSRCLSTDVIYNHFRERYGIAAIVAERPMRGAALIKRRIRKLGLSKVIGQVLFRLMVIPFLRHSGRRRRDSILREAGISSDPVPGSLISDIGSVNSGQCRQLLMRIQPDLVIVSGTRIISEKTLNCINAPFINLHSGITPEFRGVHGGYWALVKQQPQLCGVTVHYVDKGIDTGLVIAQALIQPAHHDNFTTYPLLQLAAGLPLLDSAVQKIFSGTSTRAETKSGESRLWSHPGILEYFYNRWFKGVR